MMLRVEPYSAVLKRQPRQSRAFPSTKRVRSCWLQLPITLLVSGFRTYRRLVRSIIRQKFIWLHFAGQDALQRSPEIDHFAFGTFTAPLPTNLPILLPKSPLLTPCVSIQSPIWFTLDTWTVSSGFLTQSEEWPFLNSTLDTVTTSQAYNYHPMDLKSTAPQETIPSVATTLQTRNYSIPFLTRIYA